MTDTEELTRERVLSMLDYDPISGRFTWKWRDGLRRAVNVRDAGTEAGTLKDGYVVIMIDGRQYRAHRLAYLIVTGEWPAADVDHRDRKRSNNSWGNIRPATRGQNHANKAKRVDNTSGYKGVHWNAATKSWRAKIQVDGKSIHLGLFELVTEAAAAYEKAATAYYGEFANLRPTS